MYNERQTRCPNMNNIFVKLGHPQPPTPSIIQTDNSTANSFVKFTIQQNCLFIYLTKISNRTNYLF